jgi:hypothetical protein
MIWNHLRLDSQTCHSSLRDPVSSNFFLASRFELSRGVGLMPCFCHYKKWTHWKRNLGKLNFNKDYHNWVSDNLGLGRHWNWNFYGSSFWERRLTVSPVNTKVQQFFDLYQDPLSRTKLCTNVLCCHPPCVFWLIVLGLCLGYVELRWINPLMYSIVGYSV